MCPDTLVFFYFFTYFLPSKVVLYFFPLFFTLAAYKSWSSTIFSFYYPQN